MFIDDMYSYDNNDEYYLDINGNVIYTEKYLKDRGYCCGNGCKHCKYYPKYKKGSKEWIEK